MLAFITNSTKYRFADAFQNPAVRSKIHKFEMLARIYKVQREYSKFTFLNSSAIPPPIEKSTTFLIRRTMGYLMGIGSLRMVLITSRHFLIKHLIREIICFGDKAQGRTIVEKNTLCCMFSLNGRNSFS